MANRCSICSLPGRQAIDEALAGGLTYRTITQRFGVTGSALTRHKTRHLSPALKAIEARAVEAGQLSTAARIEYLFRKAQLILESAESGGQGMLSLAAIRELRSLTELLARVTGELDERPQVQVLNVQSAPEWVALRGRIVAVLRPFPDALGALTRALAGDGPAGYRPMEVE